MCMCVYVRVFLCGCGCGCDVCINICDICFLSKRLLFSQMTFVLVTHILSKNTHIRFDSSSGPSIRDTHLELMILRWHLPLSHTYCANALVGILSGPHPLCHVFRALCCRHSPSSLQHKHACEFVCLFVCVSVRVFVCRTLSLATLARARVWVCVPVCVYVYVPCVCVCVRERRCVYVYRHSSSSLQHERMCEFVCMCIYVYLCMYV